MSEDPTSARPRSVTRRQAIKPVAAAPGLLVAAPMLNIRRFRLFAGTGEVIEMVGGDGES